MRSRTLHGAAIVPDGDGYLHIQAVGTDEVRGYLVHGARDAANDPLQAAAAAFAASLLALDLESQHVVRILQHRREQDATDRLIRGVSPAVATKLLRSFGINADRVRVAVVDVPAESGNDEVHYIAAQLPEALVGSTALGVLAVLPVDLDHAVDRLVAAAPDRPVGLGGAVRPSQCPISLRQALRGVKLARQRGGSGVVDVLALGSAKLLLGGVSVEMLQSYADATLQALDGASGGDTLLATLRAWLASGGVAESTAASLGIHRHTLRGRIDRIERLTGRRLANGHDRGEMWLAFEARDLSAAVEA
jgi:purine catabolism regulator